MQSRHGGDDKLQFRRCRKLFVVLSSRPSPQRTAVRSAMLLGTERLNWPHAK